MGQGQDGGAQDCGGDDGQESSADEGGGINGGVDEVPCLSADEHLETGEV